MWQTIENKASFIEQFRSGGIKGRTMSEINTEAMSSAEMKAAASGNPLALEEIKLKSDINKLERLKKSELAARASEKNKILNFNRAIESIPKYIKGLKSVIFSLTNNPQKIEGKTESSKDKNETDENKLKKKEKINHDIKVYDSASEFNTYPDYISAANAIKEKIKLSDDNASVDYPLFNYRGVDFDFEVLDVKDKAGFYFKASFYM